MLSFELCNYEYVYHFVIHDINLWIFPFFILHHVLQYYAASLSTHFKSCKAMSHFLFSFLKCAQTITFAI